MGRENWWLTNTISWPMLTFETGGPNSGHFFMKCIGIQFICGSLCKLNINSKIGGQFTTTTQHRMTCTNLTAPASQQYSASELGTVVSRSTSTGWTLLTLLTALVVSRSKLLSISFSFSFAPTTTISGWHSGPTLFPWQKLYGGLPFLLNTVGYVTATGLNV